tara:strand:+ start:31 stop:195 length:165 start_codon:yes stop_codon:yes gene_type:complete
MKLKRYGNEIRKILEHHYNWCKTNGRDTTWYVKYKENNVLLVTTKNKRVKEQRL